MQVTKQITCCDLSLALYCSSAPNLYLSCLMGWALDPLFLCRERNVRFVRRGAGETMQEEKSSPSWPKGLPLVFLLLHHCQRPVPQPTARRCSPPARTQPQPSQCHLAAALPTRTLSPRPLPVLLAADSWCSDCL